MGLNLPVFPPDSVWLISNWFAELLSTDPSPLDFDPKYAARPPAARAAAKIGYLAINPTKRGSAVVKIPAAPATNPPMGVKNNAKPANKEGHQKFKNLPILFIFSIFSSSPNQFNALLNKTPITVNLRKFAIFSHTSLKGATNELTIFLPAFADVPIPLFKDSIDSSLLILFCLCLSFLAVSDSFLSNLLPFLRTSNIPPNTPPIPPLWEPDEDAVPGNNACGLSLLVDIIFFLPKILATFSTFLPFFLASNPWNSSLNILDLLSPFPFVAASRVLIPSLTADI